MKMLKRDYFLREQILGADLTYNTQVSDEKDVHCTMHIRGPIMRQTWASPGNAR